MLRLLSSKVQVVVLYLLTKSYRFEIIHVTTLQNKEQIQKPNANTKVKGKVTINF